MEMWWQYRSVPRQEVVKNIRHKAARSFHWMLHYLIPPCHVESVLTCILKMMNFHGVAVTWRQYRGREKLLKGTKQYPFKGKTRHGLVEDLTSQQT